jgi:5'-methylthioadenosine phosphorylase
VGGPRTKTPAENRLWARLGAQVNSMTLGPEVVLANELEIPCAGLVVGHKYSVPEIDNPAEEGIAESLDRAREATWRLVHALLHDGRAPDFGNHIYRFGA